jgi:hypothetical protein
MALKPCRECGVQVSTGAEVCPHCGVRSPAAADPLAVLGLSDDRPNTKGRGGCATIIAIIFAGIGGVIIVGSFLPNESKNTETLNPSCQTDWTKCADNEQLVNSYKDWSLAQVKCKREANNQVRYGSPVWPWLSFSTFHTGNDYVTSGIAIAIEPDAQFQNGFGAMVHSRVICTYDLRTKLVVEVSISPR